jgi:plasmid stability protein
MATITLHDVPDEVLSRLEQCAQAHGRSLYSEAVDCLTRQAIGAADAEFWLRDVEALRAQILDGPFLVQELAAATQCESC